MDPRTAAALRELPAEARRAIWQDAAREARHGTISRQRSGFEVSTFRPAGQIRLRALRAEPMVTLTRASKLRSTLETACQAAGFAPRIVAETSDLGVMVELAAEKVGVAVLPASGLGNAAGLVPHMVFLVDYIARGLGQGLASGARHWVLFGIGAMLGPLVNGRLADRVGFAAALRLAFIVQAGCVALLAASSEPWSLILSSFVIGAMVPGVVPLVLGRVHELLPDDADQQRRAWGRCTAAFAVGQAAAAYGFSFIFAQTAGGYRLLYSLGAIALALAFVIDISAASPVTRPRRAVP